MEYIDDVFSIENNADYAFYVEYIDDAYSV